MLFELALLAAPLGVQLGPGTNLGRLLIAIVALLVIVLIGRFVLAVAWRLLILAGLVIGALYVLSVVLG